MIVRRNLKITIIARNSWRALLFYVVVGLLAVLLHVQLKIDEAKIPFFAVGALGTALAIFLAFRNGSSYDRWWEARKLWGALVNTSRTWGRQVTTFLTVDRAEGEVDDEELSALHRELVYRQIAFNHALRMHLRKQTGIVAEIAPFVPAEELARYERTSNVPALLVQRQGERLRDVRRRGLIDDFRHMELDQTLTRLYDIQGGCERIKNTPLPRQYDYFPRVFLWVFTFYMPFGLVGDLGVRTMLLSVPVSFLFYVLEGVGRFNEDPFENRIQDTPMTALCRTMEINLREQLGETSLPPPLAPVDGFLF